MQQPVKVGVCSFFCLSKEFKPRQICSSLGKLCPSPVSGKQLALGSCCRPQHGELGRAALQLHGLRTRQEFVNLSVPPSLLLSLWRSCHLIRWNSSPGSQQECQGWEMETRMCLFAVTLCLTSPLSLFLWFCIFLF